MYEREVMKIQNNPADKILGWCVPDKKHSVAHFFITIEGTRKVKTLCKKIKKNVNYYSILQDWLPKKYNLCKNCLIIGQRDYKE